MTHEEIVRLIVEDQRLQGCTCTPMLYIPATATSPADVPYVDHRGDCLMVELVDRRN